MEPTLVASILAWGSLEAVVKSEITPSMRIPQHPAQSELMFAEFLEKRHQFLGDIYHSLGACYTALAVAYLGYLFTFGYISLVETLTFLSGLTPLLSGITAIREVAATISVQL